MQWSSYVYCAQQMSSPMGCLCLGCNCAYWNFLRSISSRHGVVFDSTALSPWRIAWNGFALHAWGSMPH
eukprot:2325850-Amphidinium_carterae.1